MIKWKSKSAIYNYIHGKNTGTYQQTLADKFYRLLRVVVDFIWQQQEINEQREEEPELVCRWIGERGIVSFKGKEFTNAVRTVQKDGSFEVVIKVGPAFSDKEDGVVRCQDGNTASITLRTIDPVGADKTSVDKG